MNCTILIDSCSYFRLARSIHPLLKKEICKEKHTLGIIKELHDEYKRNSSLRNKFHWVEQIKYVENRQRCFSLSSDQKAEINIAFYFIRETARDMGIGASKVDIIGLAYAYILKISLVTDDADLLNLAKEYDVKSFNTLELLKMMRDCKAITIEKVREIASYWVYLNDTPKSYRSDFMRLFGSQLPK